MTVKTTNMSLSYVVLLIAPQNRSSYPGRAYYYDPFMWAKISTQEVILKKVGNAVTYKLQDITKFFHLFMTS